MVSKLTKSTDITRVHNKAEGILRCLYLPYVSKKNLVGIDYTRVDDMNLYGAAFELGIPEYREHGEELVS